MNMMNKLLYIFQSFNSVIITQMKYLEEANGSLTIQHRRIPIERMFTVVRQTYTAVKVVLGRKETKVYDIQTTFQHQITQSKFYLGNSNTI